MKILVLNAGSSSQKSSLYDLPDECPDSNPRPSIWQGQSPDIRQTLPDLWQGESPVIDQPGAIDVVGHRVVHGGADYGQAVWIDEEVKAAIARLAAFAPVHNPVNLAGIEAIESVLGDIPQVAVFDTAFHATLPADAYTYGIPAELTQQGLRRYGFHGTSHHYCAQRAGQILDRDWRNLRMITCHLGNGCSLAAIRQGQSVDTTMGFTPLDGLVMGNRSGAVDPGILIHLMRQGYSADELEHLLNQESGLKGISGVSNDMRDILAAIAQGNEQAALALAVYQHRLAAAIAALLPGLGGLDVLVFTAGVGENTPRVRSEACRALDFIGVRIDERKNESHPVDVDIALPDSTVRVLVIQTHEDWAIAQECRRLWRQLKGEFKN
jgi:acetate kinase